MKKKILFILLLLLAILTLCACSCKHKWVDATCTAPKTCSSCGQTEGKPIEHTWSSATCTAPKTCSSCEITDGDPRGHTWSDATCTSPKTCAVCKITEGEPIGHIWSDATCTFPKTCSACRMTEGEPAEHTWNDATCTAPKICSACGKEEGIKLAHSYGEWKIETEATVLEKGNKVRYCNHCEQAENKSYDLSTYIQDKKFIFTPKEYRQLFFDNFVNLRYSKFGGAQIRTNDGQVVVAIMDNVLNNVGNIGFVVDSDSWKMASSSDKKGFEGVVMMISADSKFVANAMLCLIMSCDPTVNESIAREVASYVLKGKFEFGGITYSLTISGNYYMMIAVVTN